MHSTKIIPMSRVATPVTELPALTANAIDADVMDAKFTVSRKMKNFCTSSCKPSMKSIF